MKERVLYFCLLALLAASPARAGLYFQDFTSSPVGATNFGDGSVFTSTAPSNTAGVTDATYKELRLTAAGSNGTFTAWMLPDLDTNKYIVAFSAKFNVVISGAFPNAADGFSFNFGPLRTNNLLAGALESGYGTGLCFSVVTYSGGNPGFFIRVQTNVVASFPYPPGYIWGTNSTTRHLVEVNWTHLGGMSVSMDGASIFTNAPTGAYTPKTGDCVVIAARTGGLNQEVRVDNVVVLTGGSLARVPTVAPYFGSQTNLGSEADKAFDGNTNTFFGAFSTNGFAGATLQTAKVVRAYSMMSYLAPGSNPRTWTFEGSNDGTNWSVCGDGFGYFINAFETRSWPATNSAAFAQYRMNVSDNASGSGNLIISEIALYEPTNTLFEPVLSGLPGAARGGADWGDYDRDGLLDFVTAGNGAQPAQVWRNTGNGSFVLAFQPAVNLNFIGDAKWGDYDNDGYLDLLVVGEQDSKLFRNQSGTNFVSVPISGFGAISQGSAEWGDYDNDGRLDFVLCADYVFQLWHNDGGGAFSLTPIPGLVAPIHVPLPSEDPTNGYEFSGGDRKDVEWLDYDDDGRVDFCFGGANRLELWHNDGGSFSRDLTNGLPSPGVGGFYLYGATMASGDHNGDGLVDLVLGGDAVQLLLLNDGAGNFSNATVGAGFGSVDWQMYPTVDNADVDGDGRLDVMAFYLDYFPNVTRFAIALNTAAGYTSLSPVPFTVGINHIHMPIEWGDMDRDGRQDMLYNGGSYIVWRNTFGASNQPPAAPATLSSSLAGNTATLVWNAGSDATTPAAALSYNLRVGNGPGLANFVDPSAATSGLRTLSHAGNIGWRTNATVRLPPGTYYWSAQAIDNSWAGSPFATEQSFVVPAYAPSILTNFVNSVKPHGADVISRADVGASATVSCEFGTNVSYGQHATPQVLTNSASATALFRVRGLTAATVYHARTFVSNGLGSSYGSDLVFTTSVDNSKMDIVVPGDTLIPYPGSYGGGQGADQAMDNKADTRMLYFSTVNAGYTITPSGGSRVRAITVFAAFDSPRDPAGVMLEGSMDGLTFALLSSNAIPAYPSYYAPYVVPVTIDQAYDVYRVTIPKAQDPGEVIHCGDIELLAFADITSTGIPITLILPTGAVAVTTASKLFDREVAASSNKLEVATVSNAVLVDVVPISGPSLFKGFETVGANDDQTSPGRTPTNITVYGSNDGTNFAQLVTGAMTQPNRRHLIQEFAAFTNTTPYARYRIAFSLPFSGDRIQVGELRLFGVPVGSAIDAWRFTHFETTNNTGTAANTSDADEDGHDNLFEYATGSDPLDADPGSAISLTLTNNARLYFNRSTTATDATLYVEGALAVTNGAPWTGIATNRNGSWGGVTNVAEGGGNPAPVSVTDQFPGTNRFLRLRVTHP